MKTVFAKIGILALAIPFSLSSAYGEINTGVEFQQAYDSNIYRLDGDEVDSWVTKIAPRAEVVLDRGASSYSLTLGAESGIYSNSIFGRDDYTDYNISGNINLDFDVRNRLNLELYHKKGHDERGTGRMDAPGKSTRFDLVKQTGTKVFQIHKPDEWQKTGFEGEYQYGAESARAGFTFTGLYESTDYTNNGSFTNMLEKNEAELRAKGLFKIAPKTALLLELRGKQIDYDEVTPLDRDSKETKVFIGAEWEATAKTTGSIRLGYQEKNPKDDQNFDDFESAAWEVDVVWAPRTYSSLEFSAFRGVNESSNALTYVDHERYALAWRHNWSSDFSTKVFAVRYSDDYEGTTRKDDVDSWGFSALYGLNEWVKLSGEYRYEDRTSTAFELDYYRNVLTFGVDLAFE